MFHFHFSRLSKNFLPKKKEDDEYQFTATKAFKLMLNEINDLAGTTRVTRKTITRDEML